ncbi:MAG: HupE/UreJ family protein [Giesbergeria sp.]|nr:HupE/UreJ family protein [Giesbergeria sp.]
MKTFCIHRKGLLALVLLGAAGAAQAHVGHEGGHAATFLSGLAHPVSGMDHLLAMVAVGLWSAVAMPQRRWQAPALFVGVMALGALLAHTGLALPLGDSLEWLIAASVILLGGLLVSGTALPLAIGLPVVAASALLHGTAHGLEMVTGESFLAYGAGFVLATALLHLGGMGLGAALQRVRAVLPRLAGALIGGAGLFMLVSRI